MKIKSYVINHVGEFGHVRDHAAYIKAFRVCDSEMPKRLLSCSLEVTGFFSEASSELFLF